MSNQNKAYVVELAQVEDIPQIVNLQSSNLEKNLTAEEKDSNGFLSFSADLNFMEEVVKIGIPVAKIGDQVVGYMLPLSRELALKVPIFQDLLEQVEKIDLKNRRLADYHFYILGQVCIKKEFRGIGILEDLHSFIKHRISDYDIAITEIRSDNLRSMRANSKMGWKQIGKYQSNNME